MIRISNIHLPLDYTSETVLNKAAKSINVDKKFFKSCTIFKRSIDARKKDNIFFLATVDAELFVNEEKICKKFKNAEIAEKYEYNVEKFRGTVSPVVVGAGPAGLFAALILAQSGANPILIERGRDVDTRTEDVHNFWKSGILDTTSNVQFGEGGAGAFSDGKLTTGTKDTRQRKVLIEFVKHGAPDEILYNAKPHIGTDKLRPTVKSIRNEIIRLGGKVMFETKLIGFSAKDNSVTGAEIEHNGTKQTIDTNAIILAIGHSARDTFEMLNEKAIPIEAKAFSVGARIEHHREMIDKSQYGKFAGNKALGAASYKTNVHLENGRGVYTFCMCPGGKVVNASSEENRLCTNGMSEFARNKENSNAALLVGITPADFFPTVRWQECTFSESLKARLLWQAEKITTHLFRECVTFLTIMQAPKSVMLSRLSALILPQQALTTACRILLLILCDRRLFKWIKNCMALLTVTQYLQV